MDIHPIRFHKPVNLKKNMEKMFYSDFPDFESLMNYIYELEKEIIRKVIHEENGNVSKAADALSIKRPTT